MRPFLRSNSWNFDFFSPFKILININSNKISINFGNIKIIEKGKIFKKYKESQVADYMKGQAIDISINLSMGIKSFTAYTMDLTKKYIEINADYRS